MKKYYKKRREHILSRSYYSRSSTKGMLYLIGFMATLVWSMIIIYPLAGISPAPIPVYLFGVVLIGLSISVYFNYRKKDSRPDFPHEWNPRKKAWTKTIASFFSLAIIICFLLVFFFAMKEENARLENNIEIVFYVFAIFFGAVFGFFFLRNIVDLIKSFTQVKSLIKFHEQGPFHAGQIISAEFINEKYKRDNLSAIIRNIKEYYSSNKNREIPKNSSGYVSEIFHEEKIPLDQSTRSSRFFQFQLPLEVQASHYDYSQPIYWEIEVSNPKRSFVHLFYVEVI